MDETDRGFWRLVAEARHPYRLFPIRTNKYCAFYAGWAPEDRQVLIGRLKSAKNITVLFFSKQGWLTGIHQRKLPPFLRPPEEEHLDVNDEEFHDYLAREFEFKPGLIHVQQFDVATDDCGFWVGPLPWHMNESLAHLEELCADDVIGIRKFIERGVCVLDWANDWWVLEKDGVEAGWDVPRH